MGVFLFTLGSVQKYGVHELCHVGALPGAGGKTTVAEKKNLMLFFSKKQKQTWNHVA